MNFSSAYFETSVTTANENDFNLNLYLELIICFVDIYLELIIFKRTNVYSKVSFECFIFNSIFLLYTIKTKIINMYFLISSIFKKYNCL